MGNLHRHRIDPFTCRLDVESWVSNIYLMFFSLRSARDFSRRWNRAFVVQPDGLLAEEATGALEEARAAGCGGKAGVKGFRRFRFESTFEERFVFSRSVLSCLSDGAQTVTNLAQNDVRPISHRCVIYPHSVGHRALYRIPYIV
jgi:hypothetical protein